MMKMMMRKMKLKMLYQVTKVDGVVLGTVKEPGKNRARFASPSISVASTRRRFRLATCPGPGPGPSVS